MWCLIKQPNGALFEVRVDPKSIGQDCLAKVCEYLDISNESDYFGLKYENNKVEELWLNLRNPMDRQVSCHNHSLPVRLSLRVKFWVPPHLLLQDSTRHQFYLQAQSDLISKRLSVPNYDDACRLIALIAQTEYDDYEVYNSLDKIYNEINSITVIEQPAPSQSELLQKIKIEHRKLRGMKKSGAEYWLLKEISRLECFGEEQFNMKGHNGVTYLSVGPHGISIQEKTKEKELLSFTNIISASSHRKTFKLEYVTPDNKETVLEVKLDSSHVASSIYRAITEKHAFYSCETVRSAVTSQFIRDLKGTIVSIFNEDSQLGKKYVFDIQRTCREVYDNARRALYQEHQMQLIAEKEMPGCAHNGENCKDSEDKYTRLIDALTCRICMDSQIDSVYLPCGHAVACTECSARVDRCPLCRCEISQSHKLFLPSEIIIKQQIV